MDVIQLALQRIPFLSKALLQMYWFTIAAVTNYHQLSSGD